MSQQSPPAIPLSYQASQCILQHMEANERYYIASRCPSLRIQHSIVPQKVHYLKLIESRFQINHLIHSFTREYRIPPLVARPTGSRFPKLPDRVPNVGCGLQAVLAAQRLQEGVPETDWAFQSELSVPNFQPHRLRPSIRPEVCYTIAGKVDAPRKFWFQTQLSIRDIIRKLLNGYFAGSKIVFVDRLKTITSPVPFGLHLQIRKLELPSSDGNESLNIVWTSVTPYTKKVQIRVDYPHDPILRNPLLSEVETLEIRIKAGSNWDQVLLSLRNKIVHVWMREPLIFNCFLLVAQNWIQNSKAIGSTLLFNTRNFRKVLAELIPMLKLTLVAREELRNIPGHASYRTSMKGNKELHVYGYMDVSYKQQILVMEVMAAKTIGR